MQPVKEQDKKDNGSRVLMVALSFYPQFSGAGTQALQLCRELVRRGIEITVLTMGTSRTTRRDTVVEIPVWRLPGTRLGRLGTATLIIDMLLFLTGKRSQFDCLHIHGAYWYSQVLVLVGRILRKKVIVKLTLLGDDDPLTIRQKQFLGCWGVRALGLADKVVSPSAELSDSYRRSGLPVRRLIEIPNGVDTEKFHPVTRAEKLKIRPGLGLPAEGPVVTFVGEICHRKGIDLLIEAWAEVVGRYPSASLSLVGPGDSNSDGQFMGVLHSRIEALKLRDSIIFHGYAGNVNEYLRCSDVFVFPSRREGMPNAVLEAMSCGLPCVVTETSGVSGIITDSVNGLLTGPENKSALASSLIYLLDNPCCAERLGAEARKTALMKFSLDDIADRYCQLYVALIRHQKKKK